MVGPDMDPGFHNITQLAVGYWKSRVLFELANSGICNLLLERGQRAEEIADALGLHGEATAALLDAAVSLKLLRKSQNIFENTTTGRRFLTSTSPESLLHWLGVMRRWTGPWSELSKVLATGGPVEDQALRLGDDASYMNDFIWAMHEFARTHSRSLAEALDLSRVTTLIDVGGGAGTYSIALCRRFPNLRITVLDLEPVLELTQELIVAEGLQDRIRTRVADYRHDAYGHRVDAVLLSNVLHQESPEVCHDMLSQAHRALRSDGMIIAQGHCLDESRVTPGFTTLHNLSARVLWSGGRSYTIGDMNQMLENAGFGNLTTRRLGALTSLVGYRMESS